MKHAPLRGLRWRPRDSTGTPSGTKGARRNIIAPRTLAPCPARLTSVESHSHGQDDPLAPRRHHLHGVMPAPGRIGDSQVCRRGRPQLQQRPLHHRLSQVGQPEAGLAAERLRPQEAGHPLLPLVARVDGGRPRGEARGGRVTVGSGWSRSRAATVGLTRQRRARAVEGDAGPASVGDPAAQASERAYHGVSVSACGIALFLHLACRSLTSALR